MKKNYILDTNVLIHCPDAIFKFDDNNIYLCPQVIDELDAHKNDHGETGYNTREALRNIKGLMNGCNSLNGIPIRDNGALFLDYRVEPQYASISENKKTGEEILPFELPDNRIINFAYNLAKESGDRTILITNDTGMMIKARRFGIETQELKIDRVADVARMYTGRNTVNVTDAQLSSFFVDQGLVTDEPLVENEYVRITGASGGTGLAKHRNGRLEALKFLKEKPCDVIPRNEGQRFLTEALLSSQDETPLVLVNGPAGTGKTLIAIACGLEQVMEMHRYKRVLICRPNAVMDNDIGFLPGTENDKISPLLRGVYDNLEILFRTKDDTFEETNDKIEELFSRGYIRAEAVGFLRGRSITDTFIIIDEAQNTTPTQMLSIITRAGEGSKIVLLGDINQIDLPRLDKANNGLSYAIEKMKGCPLCDIITFKESECTRSKLAKEAADRLKL